MYMSNAYPPKMSC